jgi:hypothetical protein
MWANVVSESRELGLLTFNLNNRSRVQFRLGLVSLGYKRQGFPVLCSFRQTTTSSGFEIDFFWQTISRYN